MERKKIVVLTGAGISAESGINTFRDAGGLWEGHDVMEVASPQGWDNDMDLVLEFYNLRRQQLNEVTFNASHAALVLLEEHHDVVVITQNVDDLHERAGSTNVIHLHGELKKVRSIENENLISEIVGNIGRGDLAIDGHQLRPHIVWFGEMVPMLEAAAKELLDAEVVIIIGTSMQVYPAAGLVAYAPPNAQIIYIDPKPTISHELSVARNLTVIEANATQGVPRLVKELC
ncbi:MAG: NAD-dependent deacetylase [Saprospiraceae bacterium]|jgi:NAD-dependent deacetylase|tara:strand:- start:561 stop:1253 length:693 start_codon:yes stop_codon:yes gene_type:complete